MKRSSSRARICSLGLVLASGAARAGEMEPPVGPIAPTMVTLDAIEPRNILRNFFGSADAVHVIRAPGQYLATQDILVPSGKCGIAVELPPGVSGPVTIDLNGFSIVGDPGSAEGLRCLSPAPPGGVIVLRGGRIAGMGGDGVRAVSVERLSASSLDISDCGGDGMELQQCGSVELTGVEVARCAANGVLHVMAGNSASLRCRRLVARDCGQAGLATLEPAGCSSVVSFDGCTVSGNGAHGAHLQHAPGGGGGGGGGGGVIRLSDSIFEGNMGDGCRVRRDRSKSVDMRVEDCALSRNAGDGLKTFFETGDAPSQNDHVVMTGTTCSGNGGNGMRLERAGLQVSNSSAWGNGGAGAWVIHGGARWEKIDNSENASDGLRVTGGSLLVLGGVLSSNGRSTSGGDGVHIDGASTVELRDTTLEGNSACGLRTRINDLESRLQSLGMLACTVSGNGAGGVMVDSATGTSAASAVLRLCTITGNGGGGGGGSGGPGGGGTVGGDGLLLDGCLSAVVDECTISRNAGRGASIGVNEALPDTTLHVARTSCDSNGSDGLSISGFRAWKLGHIHDSRNAGWGIHVGATCVNGEMEDCRASGNFGGIRVDSVGNTVVRNSCTAGPMGAMVVAMPGNVMGPIVDETTIAGTGSPHANIVH